MYNFLCIAYLTLPEQILSIIYHLFPPRIIGINAQLSAIISSLTNGNEFNTSAGSLAGLYRDVYDPDVYNAGNSGDKMRNELYCNTTENATDPPKLVALTGVLITSVSAQIMAYPSQLDILIRL